LAQNYFQQIFILILFLKDSLRERKKKEIFKKFFLEGIFKNFEFRI